jgi:hypothetical protein
VFAEQIPELATRNAQFTPRLKQTLVKIGLESGGEPGSRLSLQLGIVVSGDTILRRVRSIRLPQSDLTCDRSSPQEQDANRYRHYPNQWYLKAKILRCSPDRIPPESKTQTFQIRYACKVQSSKGPVNFGGSP